MRFVVPKLDTNNVRSWDRARGGLLGAINALDNTKTWAVTIEEHKKTRTLSQNRMLWALYGDILRMAGEALNGFDKEDLHTWMLGEFSGWETVEGFGQKRMKPLHRSSKMDTKTFNEFVDFIIRKIGEHGISL